jgi:hypothetical protein
MADFPNHAGAGLIKIRGDEVWRNGTALYYHSRRNHCPVAELLVSFCLRCLKIGVWCNFLAEPEHPVHLPAATRGTSGCDPVLADFPVLSGNLLSQLAGRRLHSHVSTMASGPKFFPVHLSAARKQPSWSRGKTNENHHGSSRVLLPLPSIQPVFNMLSPDRS